MKIAIINAYSAGNRGDGLLVDMAMDLCRASTTDHVDFTVVASQAESFKGLDAEVVPALPGRSDAKRACEGAVGLVSGGRWGLNPVARRAIKEANLVVSVGGGYLRGGRKGELVRSTLLHVPQLIAASRSRVRWILLPQSIGPYGPLAWRLIKRLLARATTVYVRDDTSLREVGPVGAVRRVPDCAILQMAAVRPLPRGAGDSRRVGLVLRALSDSGTYDLEVAKLAAIDSYDFIPLLQSSYAGNDDRDCYPRLVGQEAVAPLDSHLTDNKVDAVVSTRLHGALGSLLKGVPAIHLSYERKGYSAFRDLGLEDFVFDARTVSASEISNALGRIFDRPDNYWGSLERSMSDVSEMRMEVVKDIGTTVGVPD